MKIFKNFEDYLSDIHADGYTGLDDDRSESYNDWLCNLDGEELIEYADEFANLRYKEGSVAALIITKNGMEETIDLLSK